MEVHEHAKGEKDSARRRVDEEGEGEGASARRCSVEPGEVVADYLPPGTIRSEFRAAVVRGRDGGAEEGKKGWRDATVVIGSLRRVDEGRSELSARPATSSCDRPTQERSIGPIFSAAWDPLLLMALWKHPRRLASFSTRRSADATMAAAVEERG